MVEHRLNCVQGQVPPPFVSAGWSRFLALPAGAKERIWDALTQPLLEPGHPGNDALIEEFAGGHEVEAEQVVAAVQCLSFLVRSAAALNLAPAALKADLAALSGGETPESQVVLARYEQARDDLRNIALRDTLAAHGKLLVGLDWRIDRVTGSSHLAGIDENVVLLTLRYLEGGEVDSVTLQLTPPAIQELRTFCDRFSG